MNSIKISQAKVSQVETDLRRLNSIGKLSANNRVYEELKVALADLDSKVKDFTDIANSCLQIYDNLINLACVKPENLPQIENSLNGIISDWTKAMADIGILYSNLFITIPNLRLAAIGCQATDINNFRSYDRTIVDLSNLSVTLGSIAKAYMELDAAVLVVKSHIMLNHHLRGDYEKDVDKILKDYKLDMPWEAVKAAYDNEDIKDNYLSTIFKDQVDGIDKLRDIYNAKESFRSLKGKVNKFSTALGSAWDKEPSAIIAVLENEGLELASEFEVLEPYAQLIGNTLKLIQLAKEKDEMTKAMGAFGDATLRLNYHTYEAVRKDTSTGVLSKDSSLVSNLMTLIEEAIELSNAKAPGAFKKITDSDKAEIKKYLVQYLNVQRAKYQRSEAADSNWMKAHVSAVMAALFEQVYVDAITEQATPEDFLKFMQSSDKVATKDKTLDGYLDSTLEKQIFRDVRQKAIAKLEEAQAIVRFYNERLVKNSSYPVKEVVRYLEELAQKLKGSADIEQSVTRRYKDLNVWQLDSVSNTELSISTSYVLSFREYQKALLYTDMINAENTMAYVDYMTAGVYDLIVRSSLLVFTMSPNAFSAALGASASCTWDSLSEQVFTKLDEAWSVRSQLTAKSLAELALIMGSTVMKEADVATGIYDLIAALDNAVIFDPPLNTELVTFSIKDVVIPEESASGTGEVLVIFRNDGEKTVAISPSVSIYASSGQVSTVDFSSNSIIIPAGQTAEFIGRFTISRSALLDSTGYTAVLNYSASEPSTVSIAAEQGPFATHFFAGTDRQIKAMRNKVSAGTLVSGWVTGSNTLIGSITVKEGQSLRIFAAAPVNGKLGIEIVSPSGKTVSALSFINDGDYAIISNCEAGVYTVKVTTPESFDNRITVEGVVSSFEKAITSVNYEKEAVVNCNKKSDDGNYLGNVNFSVSESAGIDAGIVKATLDFDSDKLTATLTGFGDGNLKAGKALNGVFTIKANPNTPSGTYLGTLKVYFNANLCDPVLLSLASTGDDADKWSISGDKVVYTALVSVVVDVTVPVAPELSVADGKAEGTVTVTGNAKNATFVILNYEYDFEDINDEGVLETYTSRSIAAILNPDSDGNFAITLSKPQLNSRISAMSVNTAGGLSTGSKQAVSGYTEPEQVTENYVQEFTSVGYKQIEGKSDVTVSLLGVQTMGLNVVGDILYRVVDSEPTSKYAEGASLDTEGWISVGAVSSFTVKNVKDGQYIEIVQILPENVYATDDDGKLTVIGTKNTLLRYSNVSVSIAEIPSFTVSGKVTPDNIKTDTSNTSLVLTNCEDKDIIYRTNIKRSDDALTYVFERIIPGTYILSIDSSDGKIKANSIMVTVSDKDVNADIAVEVIGFAVTGNIVSYGNSDDTVTVSLISGSDVVDSVETADGSYSFANVSSGVYTLIIRKKNHATRSYEIAVEDADVVKDVKIYLFGDVNDDGKVNNLDRLILTRYLANWVDYPEESVDLITADVNCDGRVNNLDRVILSRYLANWVDYPELPLGS